MSLVKCPECGGEISDKAVMCPHCGLGLRGRPWGFEYRSRTELFGLPLVHVVLGPTLHPLTGQPRVAKGIIAIGGVAFGVVAIGGLAVGAVALGGLGIGLAALGGCAVGILLAMGGMAVGLVAIGGGALGYYAFGGGALGVHALGGNVRDGEAIEFFRRLLGAWVDPNAPGGA